MRGSHNLLLVVLSQLVLFSSVATAQTDIGGWRIQGVVQRRGAERADDQVDVTLAIFEDGTYFASTFLACDRGTFSCEFGTWRRNRRGKLILRATFPVEYDPPLQLSLARCFYANPFLTSATNKPRVKKYRHMAMLGGDGRLSIQTTGKVSARFVFGRNAVRAAGSLLGTSMPIDEATDFLRKVDCYPPP